MHGDDVASQGVPMKRACILGQVPDNPGGQPFATVRSNAHSTFNDLKLNKIKDVG